MDTQSVQHLLDGNPYSSYGIFLGAVVPNSLLALKELSSDDKIVFSRLLSYCGKNKSCNPGVATLAASVGMSQDKVERSLKRLTKLGYIRRNQTGNGRAATTELIWKSSLTASLRAGSATAPLRELDTVQLPQNQGAATADLRELATAPLREPIKEEEVQFEEVHEVKSTTTREPVLSFDQKPTAGWWNDSQLQEAREKLGSFSMWARVVGKPDSGITKRILVYLTDWADFELYVGWLKDSYDSAFTNPKVKSWAYFETDVKRYWPDRRQDYIGEKAKAEQEARQREQVEAAKKAERQAERQRVSEEQINPICEAKPEPTPEELERERIRIAEHDQWMAGFNAREAARAKAGGDQHRHRTQQRPPVRALPHMTGMKRTSELLAQLGV